MPHLSRRKGGRFLFTILRAPGPRALSVYYAIRVTRGGKPREACSVIDFLASVSNYLVDYIAPKHFWEDPPGPTPPPSTAQRLDTLLRRYDFVGVIERLDESLVVLAMLLEVDLSRVLYLSAKDSRHMQYDDKGFEVVRTQHLGAVDEYLAGPFRERNAADVELHRQAHLALDRTIQALQPAFGENLRRFEELRRGAARCCAGGAVWPYARQGPALARAKRAAKGDCYWHDNGCGFPCMDRLTAAAGGPGGSASAAPAGQSEGDSNRPGRNETGKQCPF